MANYTDIDDVVGSYSDFLKGKYPEHGRMFEDRFADSPASARAEAVVFSLMQAMVGHVEPMESLSDGGPDFRCASKYGEFVVEVTALDSNSVDLKSEWPDNGGSYRPITQKIRAAAKKKQEHLSRAGSAARVLCITSEYRGAGGLLGPLPA